MACPGGGTPDGGTGGGGGNGEDGGVTADAGSDGGTLASAVIGANGGTLTGPGGVAVSIPAGALTGDQTVVLRELSEAPPAANAPRSKLYRFEPEGLVFARPVQVKIPLNAGTTDAMLFWSQTAPANGFEALGGRVESGMVVGEVLHFSRGFAGAPAATRVVRGTRTTLWASMSHPPQHQPPPAVSQPAILRTGADGGVEEVAATTGPNGTFSFDNVPAGNYWLRSGNLYVQSSASAIDLGEGRIGRPDAVQHSNPSPIELNLTGLSPFRADDVITLSSFDVDTVYSIASWLPCPADPRPMVGATTVALTFDSSNPCWGYGFQMNRIEGSKGDRALVLQQTLSAPTDGGLQYYRNENVFAPQAFDTNPDAGVTLAGAFTPLALDKSINAQVKVSEYKAVLYTGSAPNVGPAGVTSPIQSDGQASANGVGTIRIASQAGGVAHGIFGSSTDLATFEAALLTESDYPTGGLTYGTLPGNWGTYGEVRFNFASTYTLPGTGGGARVTGGGLVQYFDPATLGANLAPVLGLVRNPTLNGQALTSPRDNVGTTPTLAWTAPTLGTPTHYRVAVHRLRVDGNETMRDAVATFVTRATSLTFPAGIITSGGSYFFAISAERSSFADPLASPLRVSLPFESATLLTHYATP